MALTDNLVSFWELEEASGTRVDAHANNDLTDNNTVTQTTGIVGNCASFASASSEYLSCTSNAELQMGDIDFTVMCWFKMASAGLTGQLVTKDDDAASSRDYTTDVASGEPRFYVNGSAVAEWEATVSDNVWHLLIGWHNATADTVNIQIDNGTPKSFSSGAVVPHVSSAQFRIGAREFSGAEEYWNGQIDQAGLWKRVLTSDERSELWNAGNGLSYAAMVGGGGGGIVFNLQIG